MEGSEKLLLLQSHFGNFANFKTLKTVRKVLSHDNCLT